MHIAAILYEADEGLKSDTVLAEVAHGLKAKGVKLAGAVQSNPSMPGRQRCEIVLEDLATGRSIRASEDRGSEARGCRLDTSALEEAVGLSGTSLASDTALVVINKFGKREAEGHGFRPLIEQAVVLGVPVLVAVKRAHLEAWTTFVGGEPALLPVEHDTVEDWCSRAIAEFSAIRSQRVV